MTNETMFARRRAVAELLPARADGTQAQFTDYLFSRAATEIPKGAVRATSRFAVAITKTVRGSSRSGSCPLKRCSRKLRQSKRPN